MRIARVGGIELVLNNWFLLLMVFFAVAGFAGKAFGIFASILWHEAAHSAAAASLGYNVKEIELFPFGGVAKAEYLANASGRAEGLIAVAGPLASLGLAAVLYFWSLRIPQLTEALTFYVNSNLILAAFNLMPALPLDGGRIIRAYLSTVWDYGRATLFVLNLTKVIGMLLAATIIIEFIVTKRINFTFIFAAFFLLLAGFKEKCYSSFRAVRIIAQKKEALAAKGILETIHLTVWHKATVKEIIRVLESDRYYIIMIVDQECRLLGTLSECELWDKLPQYGLYCPIKNLIE